MTSQEPAWQAAEAAAEALAPEAGEFASVDLAGFGESTVAVLMRAAGHPADMVSAGLRFWTSLARIGPVAAARWLGAAAEPPVLSRTTGGSLTGRGTTTSRCSPSGRVTWPRLG
jgi:hypothetical protein